MNSISLLAARQAARPDCAGYAIRKQSGCAQDVAHARSLGVSPGGDIFIHGLPNGMGALEFGFRNRDWTDGCIAVNNEEIWNLVRNDTPIEIVP